MIKRNLMLIVLCVFLICSCAMFASCNFGSDDGSGNNTGGNGSVEDKPSDQKPPVDEHKHTMVKTEKVEPSCKASGTEEYYTCSGCKKLFSDAEGKKEISSPLTIDALPHSRSETKEDENGFFQKCENCDARKSVSAPEADSYSAVKNNDFSSDKSYKLEMHYGSNGAFCKARDGIISKC